MQRGRDRNREQEYWFMRLREKLFDDRELVEIESLDEGFFGTNFCYLVEVLYMKLMCYSIKNEGEVYFIVEREGAKDLADILISRKFFPESKRAQVRQALAILEDLGLVWVMRNISETHLYIPEVDNMTGKSSKRADEQRRIDRRRKLNALDDSRKEYGNEHGYYKNIYLTDEEFEDLKVKAEELCRDLNRAIENISLKKHAAGCAFETGDYIACLEELGIKKEEVALSVL